MNKPDFSGTWKFNPEKSKLEIPTPDSATFLIKHDEPDFQLSRTMVFEGNTDTFSVDLTTDGAEISFEHRGLTVKSHLIWQGKELIFASILTRGDEKGTNFVKYRFEDQGQTFIAEESFTGFGTSYNNLWVLENQ